jgi:hypothetical protein
LCFLNKNCCAFFEGAKISNFGECTPKKLKKLFSIENALKGRKMGKNQNQSK